MQQTISTAPLSDAERAELRSRVERDGEVLTSRRIGVARNTLGRLVAGFDANKPTIVVTRIFLAQRW